MSQADIPSRIELMKLKAIVDALSLSVVTQIQNTDSIIVADTPTEFSLRDGSSAKLVFIRANTSGQFGAYFPEVTSDTVDGTNVISDISGRTFILFQ